MRQKKSHRIARGGSRLVMIHGKNIRTRFADCIIQGWRMHLRTTPPILATDADTHRAIGQPLTARHKNNFETAVADIRASEKARKKTKGKGTRRM